jgi:hypothetical protein
MGWKEVTIPLPQDELLGFEEYDQAHSGGYSLRNKERRFIFW